jgi:ComF family protein
MSTTACQVAQTSPAPRRLPRWAAQWRRRAVDLLYPPRCASCEEDLAELDGDLMLCRPCRESLAPAHAAWCLRCGAPAQEPSAQCCDLCRAFRLRFDTVVSLSVYRSELRDAVLRMKRRDAQLLSTVVARWYCDQRGSDLRALRPDVVVPVPMHWRRRLTRGVNSPDILAECLARHLRVPVAWAMVVRRRNTKLQATLPPRRRFENVRGAFRLRQTYDMDDLRVVLVDDILTTGATCSEIAGLIKQAGAAFVAVAVLARSVGEDSSRFS